MQLPPSFGNSPSAFFLWTIHAPTSTALSSEMEAHEYVLTKPGGPDPMVRLMSFKTHEDHSQSSLISGLVGFSSMLKNVHIFSMRNMEF